ESLQRFQRRPDRFGPEITDAAEGIDQAAIVFFVQADGHGIDSEIPPELIVRQRTGFHGRLARVCPVAFLTRTHEFYFPVAPFDLGRSEVLEIRYRGLRLQ